MIYWIITGAAGFVLLATAIILQQNKFHKLAKKFDELICKHNGFVDLVRDDIDNIYDETNERIDEINKEFMNVYDVLKASKEFADDATDTMELMVDTDELIINRLNSLEDDVDMMWQAVEEHDEILYSFFDEQPEQVEEPKEKKTKKAKKNKK